MIYMEEKQKENGFQKELVGNRQIVEVFYSLCYNFVEKLISFKFLQIDILFLGNVCNGKYDKI